MASARSTWKGFIRFSLVSIPVKAYTATASDSEVHFRQLHKECHSPINYRKTCPIHGELKNDEIVSGYEHSPGQYVIIEPDELDKLRPEGEKAINIDGFVDPDSVDPLFFSGKTHYLLPDGPMGLKPYFLLHKGMVEEKRCAVAKLFWFGREHVVLLRPLGRLIAMSTLNFPASVKEPAQFDDELTTPEVTSEEMKLARTLIDASTLPEIDLSQYKDHYNEAVLELVKAKVEGKEIVAPPQAEAPKVLDLMDALMRSVKHAQSKKEEKKAFVKKMAPSARRQATEKKRKKSS